jgi:RHS repeat-associated protein
MGMAVGTKQYDAFGAARGTTGVSLPFGYTAEQEDAESGLVYLRARYLDPSTGRFLTIDLFPGIQVNPATRHAYGYVRNQPTMLRDPRGLCGEPTTTTLSTGNDCGGGDISAAEAAVEFGQQLAQGAAPLPGAGGATRPAPGGRNNVPPAPRQRIDQERLDHTFDRHAHEWFGRQVPRTTTWLRGERLLSGHHGATSGSTGAFKGREP